MTAGRSTPDPGRARRRTGDAAPGQREMALRHLAQKRAIATRIDPPRQPRVALCLRT